MNDRVRSLNDLIELLIKERDIYGGDIKVEVARERHGEVDCEPIGGVCVLAEMGEIGTIAIYGIWSDL
ncbi:hypothetical protein PPYC2_21800 [Paenibacillus polymyxa]|uniref:hypothetical protein n=1 Tax=Paenibacillus polymyxa TaxID=1406 RepID=UPI0008FBA412|nr:hypothetical protein [Paenibacillus polymyxa]APB77420.1 hypothetical protein PPYC2_21800 [Paenibacillus polymyxa]